MPFRIIRNDITNVSADAIVNTANPMPVIGRGTDSAIYYAAGRDELLKARQEIGEINPGDAVHTPAFGLDARYIIHTVGPKWRGGEEGEFETLGSCYRQSLLLANYLGCKSIAFPMISSGSYGMPKDKALKVALDEISDFLMVSEMDVTLVVFDRTSFELSNSLLDDVKQYIDENYVEEKSAVEYAGTSLTQGTSNMRAVPQSSARSAGPRQLDDAYEYDAESAEEEDEMMPLAAEADEVDLDTEEDFDAYFHSLYEESIMDASEAPSFPSARKMAPPDAHPAYGSSAGSSYRRVDNLDEAMSSLGLTFQQKLLDLIDEKGFTDTQVYKKANIDRKLFSKIRCNENYKPSKNTVLALAISLELNMDETVDLLKRAGLALQPSSKADLIVQYCIDKEIFDIYEVNSLLFEYDQQLLG